MASMKVTVPDQMKAWVEEQSRSGRYRNSSDVVRALIRREQVKAEKVAAMQALIDEARASGVSSRTPRQITENARTDHCNQG